MKIEKYLVPTAFPGAGKSRAANEKKKTVFNLTLFPKLFQNNLEGLVKIRRKVGFAKSSSATGGTRRAKTEEFGALSDAPERFVSLDRSSEGFPLRQSAPLSYPANKDPRPLSIEAGLRRSAADGLFTRPSILSEP
jgi:hypothetical protein